MFQMLSNWTLQKEQVNFNKMQHTELSRITHKSPPNFNLIPSVKVLGDSDRLPESIIDTINTLRLYSMYKD